jgi:hypothetical protein
MDGWMALTSCVRSIRIEGTITQDKMLVHGTSDEMSGEREVVGRYAGHLCWIEVHWGRPQKLGMLTHATLEY